MSCEFQWKLYRSFNNRQFFIATFIDIHDNFDSVHILILLFIFVMLNLPLSFINTISLFFSHRTLYFSSSFSSKKIAVFPLVYLKIAVPFFLICIQISLSNTLKPTIMNASYALDWVVFCYNMSLDSAITSLNNCLEFLLISVSTIYLFIALDKCKSIIF